MTLIHKPPLAHPPLANWNGEEMPLDQVKVPVLDRSFFFGDAVYEALRVYRGRVWMRQEHFERLENSLEHIGIPCNLKHLENRMDLTLAHSGVKEGLIYIQISRGSALRSHAFPKCPLNPNELIYVEEWDSDRYGELRSGGAQVITHPDIRWRRCDIKSTNLLGNCLAAQAAAQAGCSEAILVDMQDGTITEGTRSSVFGVRGGILYTRPLGPQVLPGITRGKVLDLAVEEGLPHRESPLQQVDFEHLEELFLASTSMEILPVASVDGRPIGKGCPGSVTQRLMKSFQQSISTWLSS